VLEARRSRHRSWWGRYLELKSIEKPARRSEQAQMARRTLERETKLAVIALVRLGRRQARPWAAIESLVGVCGETLRGWQKRWAEDRLIATARGRPLDRSDVDTRNMVLAMLGMMGANTPVTTLRELFPMMGRRELEDIVARYRRVMQKRGVLLHEVTWRNNGAVWAMDFTEPPAPIDREYGQVLVVRDLGSGRLLLSLPTTDATQETVRAALRALFVEHCAPLVLKSDNGSGFIADATRSMLEEHGVIALLSPPSTPRFNGACEAGIGSLKVRAHHEATRHGRPGEWTVDDVETARLTANATARPLGAAGPVPDELWDRRVVQRDAEARRLLKERVETCTTEERERVGDDDGDEPRGPMDAAIRRIAICRALVQLGYVQLRRRRFSLPIASRRTGKNS
jgi:transposase InsO family protein